jgi:type I restriction enzyme M protein
MWNQKFGTEVYENDTFNRFTRGTPPASLADWGWIQHMVASLNDPSTLLRTGPSTSSGRGGGKMAVVLDTGAVSRGSGNQGSNKERDVRKTFVEGDLVTKGDLVEAVVLLPENLFYNTTAPGIIMVLNKAKAHPGEVLLINASRLCAKGRPKNYLTDEHIQQIDEIYRDWRIEDGLSAVITIEEAARNDYNLSPSRYVASNDQEPPLPLEEERAEADAELDAVLQALGLSTPFPPAGATGRGPSIPEGGASLRS